MKAKRAGRQPHIVIGVDPGLSGTGWALWTRDRVRRGFDAVPAACGIVTSSRRLAWRDKIAAIEHTFVSGIIDITRWGTTTVFVEMPEWQGSAKSAMTWTTGDMQKLTYLVGYLDGCAQLWAEEFVPVPVSVWKGQLPKDVVQRRIEKIVGLDHCRALKIKSHAWDAVGIGLYGMKMKGWL